MENTFYYRFAKQFEYLFATFVLPLNALLEAIKYANVGTNRTSLILAIVFIYWELGVLLLKEHRKELSVSKIKNYISIYNFYMAYTFAGLMITTQTMVSGYYQVGFYLILITLAFIGKFLLLKRISKP